MKVGDIIYIRWCDKCKEICYYYGSNRGHAYRDAFDYCQDHHQNEQTKLFVCNVVREVSIDEQVECG